MQKLLDTEKLVGLISRFGAAAMEARQVSRRIVSLLPTRLMDLKREHSRQHTAMRAERMALADQRFEAFLNESVEISFQATHARIQYETHAMLFRARQSLRAFDREMKLRRN